jgi:hypothetical protein
MFQIGYPSTQPPARLKSGRAVALPRSKMVEFRALVRCRSAGGEDAALVVLNESTADLDARSRAMSTSRTLAIAAASAETFACSCARPLTPRSQLAVKRGDLDRRRAPSQADGCGPATSAHLGQDQRRAGRDHVGVAAANPSLVQLPQTSDLAGDAGGGGSAPQEIARDGPQRLARPYHVRPLAGVGVAGVRAVGVRGDHRPSDRGDGRRRLRCHPSHTRRRPDRARPMRPCAARVDDVALRAKSLRRDDSNGSCGGGARRRGRRRLRRRGVIRGRWGGLRVFARSWRRWFLGRGSGVGRIPHRIAGCRWPRRSRSGIRVVGVVGLIGRRRRIDSRSTRIEVGVEAWIPSPRLFRRGAMVVPVVRAGRDADRRCAPGER